MSHDDTWTLAVTADADIVPRARRAGVAFAAGAAPELAKDVALAVTELVTNAQLHGVLPGVLRLRWRSGAVRVEVEDRGRQVPRLGGYGVQAVTGRGLALVAALSRSWGVDPTDDGKVVWAELDGSAATVPGAVDVDGLLRAWDQDAATDEVTVDLGVVPTSLLVEAKAHVDNLVRELTLAAAGAETEGIGISPQLATLVDGVVRRFSAPRMAIKRVALDAAARGEPTARLRITVPLSSLEAGGEYLAALDEADRYARAARLLTLATPPTHRAFRRWYVEALGEQLRARRTGTAPPPVPSFGERLMADFDALGEVQADAARVSRLQAVTAALAEVTTVEDATRVLLVEGVQALGASGGTLFLVDDDGVAVPAAVGYPDDLVRRLAAERPGDNLPATTAARTGRPVWIESREDRNALFPEMAGLEPETEAICAVPLATRRQVLGALRFSFDKAHLFDPEERDFVQALAAQATLALQRSELVAAERAARSDAERLAAALADTADRLRLLQTVTAELTAAHDVEAIVHTVLANATGAAGADAVSLFLVGPDGRDLVRQGAGCLGAGEGGSGRVALAAPTPVSVAARTGRLVTVMDGAEVPRRYPSLGGDHPVDLSLLAAPLQVGEHRMGVLVMGFRADRRIDRATQESFVTALADACSQALERAMAADEAAETGRRLRVLAEASSRLSGVLDPSRSLPEVAEVLVGTMAHGCFIELAQRGGVRPVAVTHREPEVARLARTILETEPTSVAGGVDGTGSLPSRAGILVTDLAVEGAERGAPGRYRRLLRAIEAASAVVVPLIGRTGTLGAMVVAYDRSHRPYGTDELALLEDLGRRIALAVETATEFQRQRGRLAAVTRVAEAAQQAILAPPPERLGSLRLAARYVSAAAEARIGGDLYEVAARPGAVRLLVGDVRGKGLDAVRKATVVLGEFRSAAASLGDLAAMARQLDARVTPYLGQEDFVTAVLAEVADDGTLTVACCGHPPALLAGASSRREVGVTGSLPLGLGADPRPVTDRMVAGERLLLFTDGLLEARDPAGRFIDLDVVLADVGLGSPAAALDGLLHTLAGEVGDELGDDLALLLAEYDPAGQRRG